MEIKEALTTLFRGLDGTHDKSTQAWLNYQTAREVVFSTVTHGFIILGILGIIGALGATILNGN